MIFNEEVFVEQPRVAKTAHSVRCEYKNFLKGK